MAHIDWYMSPLESFLGRYGRVFVPTAVLALRVDERLEDRLTRLNDAGGFGESAVGRESVPPDRRRLRREVDDVDLRGDADPLDARRFISRRLCVDLRDMSSLLEPRLLGRGGSPLE